MGHGKISGYTASIRYLAFDQTYTHFYLLHKTSVQNSLDPVVANLSPWIMDIDTYWENDDFFLCCVCISVQIYDGIIKLRVFFSFSIPYNNSGGSIKRLLYLYIKLRTWDP
jgi:hypothetical protein